MTKPLEGILVVSFDQVVAAPLAARRLADAGARVIKLERKEGDAARGHDRIAQGASSYFAWLNRGKELVVVDMKAEADRRLFDALIAKADIFIQNLRPGALAGLGYPIEALLQRYPKLIACSISGYGDEGPYADRKAYDLLIQAETGLASVTGGPEAPARVGVSIVDIATGLHAYEAILEALIGRGRTGKGADIRVSMFDTTVELMAVPLLHGQYGTPPKRIGFAHPSLGALRRVRERRRPADPHLDPERPRMGGVLHPHPGAARTSSRTRVSSTTRRAPPTGATPTVWSRPASPRATSPRWPGNSRRRRSPSPGSTRCSTCCGIRTSGR